MQPMEKNVEKQLVVRTFEPDMNALKQTAKQLAHMQDTSLNLYGQAGEVLIVVTARAYAQAAATEAFSGSQDEIEVMRQAFETRRNYLYERMSAIPGVHPVRPEATFYMLMNLDQLIGKTLYGDVIHDADDFARVFLREGLVAVVPCTGFGAPNYVRWSFAVSMENIKEGMDRLEKFLKNA